MLKGKQQGSTLYTLVPEAKRSAPFTRDYQNAYERFASGDANSIRQAFLALVEHHPDEPLAQFHARRVRDGLLNSLIIMEEK